MVVGLGIDMVEVDRVGTALERWGDRLVARLMGPEEAARLPRDTGERVQALALAIAGKEAASKALGTGWTHGIGWRDVDVEIGPPPGLRLRGAAAERAGRLGATKQAHVLLEVRGDLALAQVRLLG